MAESLQQISGRMVDGVLTCRDASGKEIKMGGDAGPRPMDVLLMAVAGCSTLTLSALLQRDGFKPSRLEAVVEGVRSEEKPRKFVSVKVTFLVSCPGLTPEAMDKYMVITERACPVMQSLSAERKLEYRLVAE